MASFMPAEQQSVSTIIKWHAEATQLTNEGYTLKPQKCMKWIIGNLMNCCKLSSVDVS